MLTPASLTPSAVLRILWRYPLVPLWRLVTDSTALAGLVSATEAAWSFSPWAFFWTPMHLRIPRLRLAYFFAPLHTGGTRHGVWAFLPPDTLSLMKRKV